MKDSNNHVLLNDKQFSQLAEKLCSELNKIPPYDKDARTDAIKTVLNGVQRKIVRNINELDDDQTTRVKELITHDFLCK